MHRKRQEETGSEKRGVGLPSRCRKQQEKRKRAAPTQNSDGSFLRTNMLLRPRARVRRAFPCPPTRSIFSSGKALAHPIHLHQSLMTDLCRGVFADQHEPHVPWPDPMRTNAWTARGCDGQSVESFHFLVAHVASRAQRASGKTWSG